MEDEKINRGYLETLSFSDLVKLADEYGVDVPEDLDRRFLICEILELVQENSNDSSSNMIISSGEGSCQDISLPKTYNETQISCVLRNPVWAFVFWDVSETDLNLIKQVSDFTIALRVCILSAKDDMTPQEVFEVEIPKGVNEQYIFLPPNIDFIRVELVYSNGTERKVLAFSSVMEIPKCSAEASNYEPWMQKDFPEIIKLSGIEKLLLDQYKNYRHSFFLRDMTGEL